MCKQHPLPVTPIDFKTLTTLFFSLLGESNIRFHPEFLHFLPRLASLVHTIWNLALPTWKVCLSFSSFDSSNCCICLGDVVPLMRWSIRNFNISPRVTPQAFNNFWTLAPLNPPPPWPGPKLCSNALPLSARFDCQMPLPKNKMFLIGVIQTFWIYYDVWFLI